MLEHGGYGVVVVGCKRCCSFENCRAKEEVMRRDDIPEIS